MTAGPVNLPGTCDTALGTQLAGEGPFGISSTVLARGARAVIAFDQMSAQLMTDLYHYLLHDSLSPPSALAAAMRAVLARDPAADPALWAAFQVSVRTAGAFPSAP
jgi:CHAT domain-containing protein